MTATNNALTPAERETLRLVVLLPLVAAETIRRLSGLREVDSANRVLASLRRRGLAAPLRPPAERGRPACLWCPTPAGRALLGGGAGLQGGEDRRLRALLAGLPLVEGLHRLVGTLAAAPAILGVAPPPEARPALRDWRHPWRGAYHPTRDSRGRAATVALHGYAELIWRDPDGATVARARVLLLADLGTAPFDLWGATVASLLAFRDAHRPSPRSYHDPGRDPLPAPVPLVVATDDPARRAEWLAALRRGALERGRPPGDYAVAVHTWEELERPVAGADPTAAPPTRRAGRRAATAGWTPANPRTPIWRGDRAGWPDALVVRPREWRCLEVLARHPFLTGTDLATVLGAPVNNVEVDRARLARRGLILLAPPPASRDGFPSRGRLAELTVAGLRARARWEGLTLGQAVRHNGFVGGGPDSPVGDRERLARNMDHTRGVAGMVVALYRAARRPLGVAAVTLWENAAACANGAVQPDARVRVAWYGATYDAIVEYDRGTEWREHWLAKARAWAGAIAHGRRGPVSPAILIVTAGNAAERRIARLLGECERAWDCRLPVLLTTVSRLAANDDGPLGAVWRGVDEWPGGERLHWLPPDDNETIREV